MAVPELKTMCATGQLSKRRSLRAFTLVELILVMTILCIAITEAAPRMSGFFRGRTQEAEARRLLSLTRYGQSRAVEEGIPVLLWFDIENRIYGIEQDPTYVDNDPKAEQFNVDPSLTITLMSGAKLVKASSSRYSARNMANPVVGGRTVPAIRFETDGSFSPASPASICVGEGESMAYWISQAQNGLNYELSTGNNP